MDKKGIIKWNYISEVGLPPKGEYDWVLVKTDFDGKGGLPHIAEVRNGKWWSSSIESGPLEEVLDCRVIAWADMQLITDEDTMEAKTISYEGEIARIVPFGKKCIELSSDDIYNLITTRANNEGYTVENIEVRIERELKWNKWVHELKGAKVYIK